MGVGQRQETPLRLSGDACWLEAAEPFPPQRLQVQRLQNSLLLPCSLTAAATDCSVQLHPYHSCA